MKSAAPGKEKKKTAEESNPVTIRNTPLLYQVLLGLRFVNLAGRINSILRTNLWSLLKFTAAGFCCHKCHVRIV